MTSEVLDFSDTGQSDEHWNSFKGNVGETSEGAFPSAQIPS